MLVVIALIALLVSFTAVQMRYFMRRRRTQRLNWDSLLSRVRPVNLRGVEEIAGNYLSPSLTQLCLQPSEMWERVGGIEGLEALSANADVILDLAMLASRWNEVEGRIVAEMIRRDGVRMKRAVAKIELATVFGVYRLLTPFQLQEAVAAYHLMRARLLGLYQVAHVGRYPQLLGTL